MLVGIDEAGRGCWAGPLVAAAVILETPLAGLTDSKLLTRLQREELEVRILQSAVAYGIGWVWPSEIDEQGLTAANAHAMQLALEQISCSFEEIIIDGNHNYLPQQPGARAVIGADKLVPAVSAASVLAKVARDRYMAAAALRFPDYGFDRHVGYGTALHSERLKLHGPCKLHRLSYKPVKRFLTVKP